MVVVVVGCGSKTGLRIPERSEDGGLDSGTDGRICASGRDTLEQRVPEVLFVIDQSRSMEFGLDGRTDAPRDDSRWALLGDSMIRAIESRGSGFSFGALLFPDAPTPIPDIQAACRLDSAVDVPDRRKQSGSPTAGVFRKRPGRRHSYRGGAATSAFTI